MLIFYVNSMSIFIHLVWRLCWLFPRQLYSVHRDQYPQCCITRFITLSAILFLILSLVSQTHLVRCQNKFCPNHLIYLIHHALQIGNSRQCSQEWQSTTRNIQAIITILTLSVIYWTRKVQVNHIKYCFASVQTSPSKTPVDCLRLNYFVR